MATRTDHSKDSPAPSVFAKEIEGFTAKSKLSRRESDIVLSLIRNITNSEEIAKYLGISTHTVNNHLKSIFEKTSTKSKTEILSSFLRYAADRMHSRSLFAKRPRVLVIDDEEVVCEFVASGLTERGMRAYTVTDPSRAVEMISKLAIDFVVCDTDMPDMSGIEVLKQIRRTYHCWPYVVLVSALPDYSVEECMHYGASGFIEKPIDIDKLFRLIMGHLAESALERAALLEIGSAEPVVLDEAYQLDETDLGFGGAFIPMETMSQKKARLGIGSVVDLTFATTAKRQEALKVRGQVVWKRATKDQGLRPGVGIRFITMSDRDQGVFERFLMDRNVTSFIPLGGHAYAVDQGSPTGT